MGRAGYIRDESMIDRDTVCATRSISRRITEIGPNNVIVTILLHVSVCLAFGAKALAQCIPPPRHVLPVSRYESGSRSDPHPYPNPNPYQIRIRSVIRIATKI